MIGVTSLSLAIKNKAVLSIFSTTTSSAFELSNSIVWKYSKESLNPGSKSYEVQQVQ